MPGIVRSIGSAFGWQGSGGGTGGGGSSGSGGWETYPVYTMPFDGSSFIIVPLAGKIIKELDMDGVGRQFAQEDIEGVGIPGVGTFIYSKNNGKFRYSDTIFAGQWFRIKYI